jgi:polysaccharide biosynthesis/export protein
MDAPDPQPRGSRIRQRTSKSNMRTAISPALPVLFSLLCGWAAAQDPQAKPPAGPGSELTDPTRMAGERGDPTKPAMVGAAVDSAYEIGPEDVITVWVYQQPNMIGQYVVGTDGMVSIPLIGEIKVGGMTKAKVEAEIIDKLKTGEIVNDPNVTVNVFAVHSKKVYISGDGIAHTGAMDLVVPTRVSEAITWAGGFRDFASKKKIRIIRIGPDGKSIKFMYNDNDVSHGRKLEQNILLKPGDHIYVD